MRTQTTITNLSAFLAAALLATACSEPTGTAPRSSTDAAPRAPAFATTPATSTGIAIDQFIGTLNEGGGPLLIKIGRAHV